MKLDIFTPSSSNPILSIARHYSIDINCCYYFADFVLREYQRDETDNVWHEESKRYFTLLTEVDPNTPEVLKMIQTAVLSSRLPKVEQETVGAVV
jgi:hypothetical protein